MAEVYLARQTGPAGYQKPCVLKRINPESERDPTHRALFLEEARLSALLNHPSIVQTIDFGEEDGVPFMAMELVEGMHLGTLLRRMRLAEERFPIRAAVDLGLAMLDALSYAHRLEHEGRPLGVVHRDVSPQNILLSRQGVAKLADFGVARVERDQGTIGARVKGKLGYMPKEQANGDVVDGRADLFSLGIVLVETLTSQKAQNGEGPLGLLDYRPRVEALLAGRPEIPRALSSLLLWMVAERPAERPPDAESLAELLRRTVEDLPARDALARFLPACLERHREASDGAANLPSPTPSGADPTELDPQARRGSAEEGAPSGLAGAEGTGAGWLIPAAEMNRVSSVPGPGEPGAVGWEHVLGDDASAARAAPPPPESRPWMAFTPPSPEGAAEGPAAAARASATPEPPRARPSSAGPSFPGPATAASARGIGVAPEGQSIDRLRTMFEPPSGRAESPRVARLLLGIAAVGAVVTVTLFARAGAFRLGDDGRTQGRLSVESEPSGAEIWLDGRLRSERTPAELTGLPVERAMVLEVRREGFLARPERVMVEIPNDELKSSRAGFKLTRARTLHLATRPPGAEVELDGKKLPGRTPLALPPRVAGQEIQLSVRLDGYLPATRAFELTAETATVTELVLERAAIVEVDVEPGGALVFLDDRPAGRAPLSALSVPAEHPFRLRAEHPGYRTRERKVDARKLKTPRIELRLEELPFSALPIAPEDKRRIAELERRVQAIAKQIPAAEAKLKAEEHNYERVSAKRGASAVEMSSAISRLESARARLGTFEGQLEEAREDLRALKFELAERSRAGR